MGAVKVARSRDFLDIETPKRIYTMTSNEAWQLMIDLASLLNATINGVNPPPAVLVDLPNGVKHVPSRVEV